MPTRLGRLLHVILHGRLLHVILQDTKHRLQWLTVSFGAYILMIQGSDCFRRYLEPEDRGQRGGGGGGLFTNCSCDGLPAQAQPETLRRTQHI